MCAGAFFICTFFLLWYYCPMLTLAAQERNVFGKALKKERKRGSLPAVFYGRTEKATPISVPFADFLKLWKNVGESSVIALEYPGKKDLNVLINDVSFDPVRGEPIHVDFYVVESDRAVEVTVPLEFTGVAPAVKELGGTLVKVLHEVEVSALPKYLPSEILVDISLLTMLTSRILVRDLKLPGGITVLQEQDEIVALVSTTKEEVDVPEKVFDATAIEVEKKGKKEEEGAEGEGKEVSAGGKSSSGGKDPSAKKAPTKK